MQVPDGRQGSLPLWQPDDGLLHRRQMLLYSQEVGEDYTPCEEDLFVL